MGLRPLVCWDCGFEFRQGHAVVSLVTVVCCQVELSASSLSLVQRSYSECRVSECDREASMMRSLWPLGALAPWAKKSLETYRRGARLLRTRSIWINAYTHLGTGCVHKNGPHRTQAF